MGKEKGKYSLTAIILLVVSRVGGSSGAKGGYR